MSEKRRRERVTRLGDLSEHDQDEAAKFARYMNIMSRADGRDPQALYDAVYGEDETGPRDFRVKH